MFVPKQERAITVGVMVGGKLKKPIHHKLSLESGLA